MDKVQRYLNNWEKEQHRNTRNNFWYNIPLVVKGPTAQHFYKNAYKASYEVGCTPFKIARAACVGEELFAGWTVRIDDTVLRKLGLSVVRNYLVMDN